VTPLTFIVSNRHNYFVGEQSVLVHNGEPDIQASSVGDAINKALAWLNTQGVHVTEPKEWRSGYYGMADANGYGYRVEFDARSGAHVNVTAHKKNGPHIKFPGNKQTVETWKRQMFCR
jgi:hypothetical protein